MIRFKRLLVGMFSALLSVASLNAQTPPFALPEIPVMITAPQERADYLATHYWQNYDFNNATLINRPEITEQAFVDFIDLLSHCSKAKAEKSLTTLMSTAEKGGKSMFDGFAKLAQRYLYDPNSPMRNDEFYLPVLSYLINAKSLTSTQKESYRFQYNMAMKNRIGEPATNFNLTKPDGTTASLYGVNSTYTLLFFNDPDCTDCKRIKEIISTAPLFKNNAKLKVVSVYSEEEVEKWKKTPYPATWINGRTQEVDKKKLYDLKAMPTLYLLDKNKRVLLKDATIDEVAEYLYRNQ